MTEQLSESEERLLFHALGYSYEPRWNEKRREERNWIGTTPSDSPDYLCIKSLVQKGYMTQGQNTPWGEEVYYATSVAEVYVVRLWNKKKAAKKPSRSKRRYQAYFDWLECHEGTFKDYLNWLKVTEDDKLHFPKECEYVKEFKEKWNI